jgi:ASC-1-like (ASCH) protein
MHIQRRTILFAPELIPLIRDGSKTLTYRLDDDSLDWLNVGDQVEAEDSSTERVFAELEIIHKSYTTFGRLPVDRTGNVAHQNKEAQRTAFKGYYNREVLDSERLLVLGFRVLRWLGGS